ncbi:MAG: hypothetical protein PHZ19_05155 [Candidatus Thermoplasmatota archaeon]|nr:hypothetical protein [Candidatus Thermoplasmatota archaeon]
MNKQIMWLITVASHRDFSDRDRDFIAELASEEARKMSGVYSFILHDIAESKRGSRILIEGAKTALTNLVSALEDNLPYKITYTSCA